MIFYTYTYKVKTEIGKAFNYFLQKEYLVKYFSQKEMNDLELISENSSSTFSEGEAVKLLFKDKDFNLTMKLTLEELRKNELITFYYFLDEAEDLQAAEDDFDDEDFGSFINKLMGQEIVYKIRFRVENEVLIIKEESEVFVNSIWLKMIWKFVGIYSRFKQRKTHIEVRKELEELEGHSF